jgi:hypothetical protein
MYQTTQLPRQTALSEQGKRRLAAQLVHTTSVEEALHLIESWDTEFALQTLLELYTRAESLAPRRPLPLQSLLLPSLIVSLAGMILTGFEFYRPWLSVGALIFAFQWCAHAATAAESVSLRSRVKELLVCLLPDTTPSSLPLVLEAAVALGPPEANPTLLHTLVRLLPYFTELSAKNLTPRQHIYLLRLLSTPHQELLIPALLALGTLGDPRDADRIRESVPGLSLRVRAAKHECLNQLDAARQRVS